MTKAERFRHFIKYNLLHQPGAETELIYDNPFQLLVAVILSAQCTDKRVNLVTPEFFRTFPSAADLARAHETEIFPYIKSVSYPNSKSKYLAGMGKMLMEKYGGKIPEKVEELTKLPGVGRKTANVIASVIYNQPAMAVDTHVFRVSARVGLTTAAKNPEQAEKQLVKNLPVDVIPVAHHWLILHGRYICTARKPKCLQCGWSHFCKSYPLTT